MSDGTRRTAGGGEGPRTSAAPDTTSSAKPLLVQPQLGKETAPLGEGRHREAMITRALEASAWHGGIWKQGRVLKVPSPRLGDPSYRWRESR